MRAVPSGLRPAFRRILRLLGTRLLGFIKGQLISIVTVGVLATTAFYLLGVPYAFLSGVLNGLAEIVPIPGPWAGGIPAVAVAFAVDPVKGLWAAVAVLAIQQVEGQVVTPLAMSKAARVHPFVTIFALVLFGGMSGFLGILLAVPLVLLPWTLVQVLWVERAIGSARDPVPPVVRD